MRICSLGYSLFRNCCLSVVAVSLFVGCKSGPVSDADITSVSSRAGSVERGKSVYLSTCIACHNVNPKLDGALGPAVADASLQLLEAKIVRGEYPAGYQPKRATRLMVALPQHAQDVQSLYDYLSSVD